MTPTDKYYENLSETMIAHFGRRNIEAYYVSDKDEALSKALRFLTPGCSVSWGGSVSLEEIGLIPALKATDCVVLDRSKAKTDDEKREFYGKVATCDFYFMSSNAITTDGQLVNIDGTGNRLASLLHGPANVIIIAGMNKVCSDVDSAIKRARNTAAPINTARLNRHTPCAETGICANCLSPDSICSQLVVTRRSSIPNRIKVILVGEALGY